MSRTSKARSIAILSPHLDDAVLSCGGQIALACAEGRPIRVITLFAGTPTDTSDTRIARYTRLRRAEDVAALTSLAVDQIVHLDHLDAIYRRSPDGGLLYTVSSVYGPVSAQERSYPRALADELERQLPPAGRVDVLAPLAIGDHVDHKLAAAAGRLLAGRSHRVRFYEDLPYALDWNSLQRKLRRLGNWRAESVPFDEASMARKIAALCYYRTQVPMLLGGDLSMSESLRAHAARVASSTQRYAERVWLAPRTG